jgi:uncharacterized membrane protein YkgB
LPIGLLRCCMAKKNKMGQQEAEIIKPIRSPYPFNSFFYLCSEHRNNRNAGSHGVKTRAPEENA